jgi:putative transposase
MPTGLKRYYGEKHLHYITCSCYRRRPLLSPARRDLFLSVLEETRQQYGFAVLGYVVMPEHFHLLLSEPKRGNVSTVMQVVKQRVTQRVAHEVRAQSNVCKERVKPRPLWQPRFYDFNVWSYSKYVEKLRYIHRNPVKRGLVEHPDQWRWSSFRFFAYGERGPVQIEVELPASEPEPIFSQGKK